MREGQAVSARAVPEPAREPAEPSAASGGACAMAPAADREDYWGPTTSTLDWCEENYAVTWYIAEFCECGRQRPGLRREAGREGAGLRGDAA